MEIARKAKKIIRKKENKELIINSSIIILIFIILNHLFLGLIKYPEKAYFSSIIFPHVVANPFSLVPLLLFGTLLFLNYYEKSKLKGKFSWSSISGKNLKYLIIFIAFLLAWYFSAYDLNLFYNQAHYFDRALLVLLLLGMFFNPLFVIPFITVLLAIGFQFDYPSCFGWTWTDKLLLINMLILFTSYLLGNLIRKISSMKYVFLSLVLLASNYFYTAIRKIYISPNFYEWVLDNELHNLLVTSYLNGWLAFVREDALLRIASTLSSFNEVFLLIAIVIELSALFILYKKNWSIAIMVGFILFNTTVFLVSGIFFFKWILLNVAFIIFILSLDKKQAKELFSRRMFYFSVILITLSVLIFSPAVMGWFDTKISRSYEMKAVTDTGEEYLIQRNFMSPYDTVFAQNRFDYLNDEKILTVTYGTTKSFDLKEKIEGSQEDIRALKKNLGTNYLHEGRKIQFERFVKRYFMNLNDRGRDKLIINKLSFPKHIWNFPRTDEEIYDLQGNVKKISITFTENYYNDSEIIQINKELIRNITIPESMNYSKEQMVCGRNFQDVVSYSLIKLKRIPVYFHNWIVKIL